MIRHGLIAAAPLNVVWFSLGSEKTARWSAGCSIFLWAAVVFAGRWIGFV